MHTCMWGENMALEQTARYIYIHVYTKLRMEFFPALVCGCFQNKMKLDTLQGTLWHPTVCTLIHSHHYFGLQTSQGA